MRLLPPASLLDVLRGRAPLVGSRTDPARPRGYVSPVEPRVLLGIAYGDLAEAEAEYLNHPHGVAEDAGVVVRALLARMQAPRDGAVRPGRPHIVAARVDNITIEGAVERIFAPEPMGRARMVHFVHPHALNLAAFDADYAALLADADIILPDGVGLRIAAKMLGVALEHNVNGTDLLPLLCARATASARPLILIGGAEGVASACADALVRSHPGLRVPFTSHGFLDAAGIARVEEAVRAHAPCVVLVGMGSPLQERWAWEHLASIPRITVLTVGGLFDFFSGRIPRSPLVWRELGLEWLWRLRQEPTRLGRRYLLGNPLFLTLAAKQRLFGPNAADRTANDGPSPDDPTP